MDKQESENNYSNTIVKEEIDLGTDSASEDCLKKEESDLCSTVKDITYAKNTGKPYINNEGRLMPARSLKPTCQPNKCKFNCSRIPEEQRQNFFDNFWRIPSRFQKWEYISRNIVFPPPGKTKLKRKYFLTINGQLRRICYKTFLATLDIKYEWIHITLRRLGHLPKDDLGNQEENGLQQDFAEESDMQEFESKYIPDDLETIPVDQDDETDSLPKSERTENITYPRENTNKGTIRQEIRFSGKTYSNKKSLNRVKEKIENIRDPEKNPEKRNITLKEVSDISCEEKLCPRKSIRKPCNCEFKCLVSEGQRQKIFQDFWNINTHFGKIEYISRRIELIILKSRNKESKNDEYIRKYFLEIGGKLKRVCETTFQKTLSINYGWINAAVRKLLGISDNLVNVKVPVLPVVPNECKMKILQKKKDIDLRKNPEEENLRKVCTEDVSNNSCEKIWRPERKGNMSCEGFCAFNCQITEKQKQKIFYDFWSIKDHSGRYEYILRHIDIIPSKHKGHFKNKKYFLKIDDELKRVCETTFQATLSIKEGWVEAAIRKLGYLFLEKPVNQKVNQKIDAKYLVDVPNSVPVVQDDSVMNRLQVTKETESNIVLTKNPQEEAIRGKEWGRGISHINKEINSYPRRRVRKPCDTSCHFNCRRISEEHRKTIFRDFWNITDSSGKYEFIIRFIDWIPEKDQSELCNRGKFTRNYFFEIDGKREKVCQIMFQATLDINDHWIKTALKKLGYLSFDEVESREVNDFQPKYNVEKACTKRKRSSSPGLIRVKNICDLQLGSTGKSGMQDLETTFLVDDSNDVPVNEEKIIIVEHSDKLQKSEKTKDTTNPRRFCVSDKKRAMDAGEPYLKPDGTMHPGRSIKQACKVFCLHNCQIAEEHRKKIFQDFWSLPGRLEKLKFISRLVEEIPAKNRKKVPLHVKRKFVRKYFFEINGELSRVCEKMFSSTLDIGKNWVTDALIRFGGRELLSVNDGNVKQNFREREKNENVTDPIADFEEENVRKQEVSEGKADVECKRKLSPGLIRVKRICDLQSGFIDEGNMQKNVNTDNIIDLRQYPEKKIYKNKEFEAGLPYIKGNGSYHPGRGVKKACVKCMLNCQNIPDAQRQQIFHDFWTSDRIGKYEFLSRHIEMSAAKKTGFASDRSRTFMRRYFLQIDGKFRRVCEKMFRSTLDISRCWIDRIKLGEWDQS